jgi:hypothetical protein
MWLTDAGVVVGGGVGAELTLQQFYQFLHEMEKAKQTLDMFAG